MIWIGNCTSLQKCQDRKPSRKLMALLFFTARWSMDRFSMESILNLVDGSKFIHPKQKTINQYLNNARIGWSNGILDIRSANPLAYPGMCVTSKCAWTDAVNRQRRSIKKHKGDFVVNIEFEVDSAAVLLLWLRSVKENLCAGRRWHKAWSKAIWAEVS